MARVSHELCVRGVNVISAELGIMNAVLCLVEKRTLVCSALGWLCFLHREMVLWGDLPFIGCLEFLFCVSKPCLFYRAVYIPQSHHAIT